MAQGPVLMALERHGAACQECDACSVLTEASQTIRIARVGARRTLNKGLQLAATNYKPPQINFQIVGTVAEVQRSAT